MAGLQDISPMVSILWVSSRVRAPARAAAAARLAAGVAAADDDDVPWNVAALDMRRAL